MQHDSKAGNILSLTAGALYARSPFSNGLHWCYLRTLTASDPVGSSLFDTIRLCDPAPVGPPPSLLRFASYVARLQKFVLEK